MRSPIPPRDLGLLLALGAIWGTSFLFITIGLESFSPVFFAAIRFDIVALAFFVVTLTRHGSMLRPRHPRQWAAIGIAAVFNVGLYHALLFYGQQFTTAGVAAVVVALNPVLTTVFSRLLLPDDRVGAGGFVGLALGFAGVALLASLKPGGFLDVQGLGELWIVAAIACWALGSVLLKRTQHGLDIFAFVAWQAFFGAILLHLSALVLEDGGHAVFTPASVASLLYLALAASGLGFVIYFTLIHHIGPIRVNLVSHIAAPFASLAGFLVLQDPVELRSLLAFVLIAAGFALVARPAKPAVSSTATSQGEAPPIAPSTEPEP